MFEPQGGARNRARDLKKKGSAFILSFDHWTVYGLINKCSAHAMALSPNESPCVFDNS